ncbi:MAG: glutaminyl-peptide cyclotransferase, partial [Crocinitomicaceae bacterium]
EDVLVSIEPSTGRVKELINCFTLVNTIRSAAIQQTPSPEVLNGIAHKKSSNTFFVTGKYWPTLFEVNFISKPL